MHLRYLHTARCTVCLHCDYCCMPACCSWTGARPLVVQASVAISRILHYKAAASIISPLHTTSTMSLSIARCAMRRAAPALRRNFCSHTRPALGALTSKQYSASGDIQSTRPFSSKDSDDDFAPKRKAVPEGADDVSKMIQQQVRVEFSLHCMRTYCSVLRQHALMHQFKNICCYPIVENFALPQVSSVSHTLAKQVLTANQLPCAGHRQPDYGLHERHTSSASLRLQHAGKHRLARHYAIFM
jgi:hypothetical protein